MFEMSGNRVLIFVTVIVVMFFVLQNCWQSKSPGEKWLYIYGDAARDYAGNLLGPGRGATIALPEALAGNTVKAHQEFVTFAPESNPLLVLAFAPNGKPTPPADPAHAGRVWLPMGDAWYVLSAASGRGVSDETPRR